MDASVASSFTLLDVSLGGPPAQAPDGKKQSKKRRLSELPADGRYTASAPAPQPPSASPPKLHLHLPGSRPRGPTHGAQAGRNPSPAVRTPAHSPGALRAPPPPQPPPQQWHWQGVENPNPYPMPAAARAHAPPKKAAGGARKLLARCLQTKVLAGVKRRLTPAQLLPFKVGAADLAWEFCADEKLAVTAGVRLQLRSCCHY